MRAKLEEFQGFRLCRAALHSAEPSHAVSLAGVPLAEAQLMWNKVIHEYGGVDVGLVWDTAKTDVPDLRKKVVEAIAKRQTESRGWLRSDPG